MADLLQSDEFLLEDVAALFQHTHIADDDIESIRGLVEFDDDLAPENLLMTEEETRTQECTYNVEWGHSGLWHRRLSFAPDFQSLLQNFKVMTPRLVDLL